MGGWDEYYAQQAKERWRSMPWHEKLLANVTLALVLMPVVFFCLIETQLDKPIRAWVMSLF